jgi:hypothetical protein
VAIQDAVSLTTITATIQRAIAGGMYDRSRIDGAAILIATGAVQKVGEHEYSVSSRSRIGVHHTVTPDGCGCEDYTTRRVRCQHDLAVRILISAQFQEDRQRAAEQQAQFGPMQLIRLREVKRRYERGEVAV